MLINTKENFVNKRIVRFFIERRLRKRRSFSGLEFKNKKNKNSENSESIKLESLKRAI